MFKKILINRISVVMNILFLLFVVPQSLQASPGFLNISDGFAFRDLTSDDPIASSLHLSQNSIQLKVSFYDIFFDMDPVIDKFNSVQNISFIALSNIKSISFLLHSDLVINEIEIWDNDTNIVLIDSWQTDYDQITEWIAGMVFVSTQININQPLDTSSNYYLHLEYTLKPEAVSDNVQDELFRFVVSEQGTRGLGWPSGLVPIIVGVERYASSHTITIKHPNDQSCMVSGNRISMIQEGMYTTETYLSKRLQATAPSFSCDTYQILTLTRNNITVELYYFEGEAATQEVLEIILEGITLFSNYLGDTGDRHYQFGYVDIQKSVTGGTSRRDTIFLRAGDKRDFENNLKDKVLFVANLFHEIAHNWNGFVQSDTWEGNDYFMWFQEGGANFLASWACEMIIGSEAANIYRKNNLERYENFQGYNSRYNLKTIPNEFYTELSDIAIAYEYGGMVWEQLILKLGNDTVLRGLSDFVQNYWINADWDGLVSINNLFTSFEKYTEIDIEEYLEQWGTSNAKIKLQIINIHTEKIGDVYETNVEINVISEKDYEIIVPIGYKFDLEQHLFNVNLTKSGKQTVSFTTDKTPNSIVIDPEYRVPRVGVIKTPDDISEILLVVATSLFIILIILSWRIIKRRKIDRSKD